MGRKIDMKKIEDVTKCQVTFSKRRSSLMKKANEIAICCDVDVAFVAFSPSGRVSKFCNKRRIEDLLHRYVNLPAESRLNQLEDVQRKLEKLKNLDHIKSETSKLQYLDKQIENLELQIKKSGLELQILEANLRDYELDPEQEPSLHLLSWCERNINHSLERVVARKNELLGQLQASNARQSFQIDPTLLQNEDGVQFSSNFLEKEQILTNVDPWITPYSAKIRESRLQGILDQGNLASNLNQGTFNISTNISSDLSHSCIIHMSGTTVEPEFEIPASFQIPQPQPIVVDHTLMNFPQQDEANARNNLSPATFSNYVPPPPPRSTSTTVVTNYATCTQFTNKGQEATQVNMLDYSKQEGTSVIQKSNLWEWEDLLLDSNFNFGFSK